MLIATSGFKGSGKDTIADYLVSRYGYTKIAFAAPLKSLLLTLNPVVVGDIVDSSPARLSVLVDGHGWDYAKREYSEVRRLMQVFGTELMRNNFGENVWVDLLDRSYPDLSEGRYVISDCRFPNEADFVHSRAGDVVWIDRPGVVSDGHASEGIAVRVKADYVLTNDDTIEELHEDMRLLLFMKGVDTIA
jgi:hypothetical protein